MGLGKTTLASNKRWLHSIRRHTLRTKTGEGRSTPYTALEIIQSLEMSINLSDTDSPFTKIKILSENGAGLYYLATASLSSLTAPIVKIKQEQVFTNDARKDARSLL